MLLVAAAIGGVRFLTWPDESGPQNQPPFDASKLPRAAEFSPNGGSILYRGQKVLLGRHYSDYEDYHGDPHNIRPSEYAKVEALTTRAPIPRRFESRSEAIMSGVSLAFPGYGVSSLIAEPSEALTVTVLEIPRAGKNRYLAVAPIQGGWVLIDDFVARDGLGISHARIEGDHIVYSDRHRAALITHPF